jgi:hypothetical protein
LADGAVRANFDIRAYMRKVPDLCPVTNLCAVIDAGTGVDEIGFAHNHTFFKELRTSFLNNKRYTQEMPWAEFSAEVFFLNLCIIV